MLYGSSTRLKATALVCLERATNLAVARRASSMYYGAMTNFVDILTALKGDDSRLTRQREL